MPILLPKSISWTSNCYPRSYLPQNLRKMRRMFEEFWRKRHDVEPRWRTETLLQILFRQNVWHLSFGHHRISPNCTIESDHCSRTINSSSISFSTFFQRSSMTNQINYHLKSVINSVLVDCTRREMSQKGCKYVYKYCVELLNLISQNLNDILLWQIINQE